MITKDSDPRAQICPEHRQHILLVRFWKWKCLNIPRVRGIQGTERMGSHAIGEGSRANFKQRYHKMQHKINKLSNCLNSNISCDETQTLAYAPGDIQALLLSSRKTNARDVLTMCQDKCRYVDRSVEWQHTYINKWKHSKTGRPNILNQKFKV